MNVFFFSHECDLTVTAHTAVSGIYHDARYQVLVCGTYYWLLSLKSLLYPVLLVLYSVCSFLLVMLLVLLRL